MDPEPWQVDVLEGNHQQLLLNCCRQAGKSTVVAILALAEAIFKPFAKILLLSKSHRQSMELFRIVSDRYHQLDRPLKGRDTRTELELSNHSRIISLPCREDTIRGFSGVSLLIIDEAARVPDDLYRAVRPMLASSGGRLICLSTPYGKRGFFWDCWARGGEDWGRIEVPGERSRRHSRARLELERRSLGESWFRQEYCCSFESVEGLVYADFARCVVSELPPELAAEAPPPLARLTGAQTPPRRPTPGLQRVGGIDFGFHNPFAAIWGVVDKGGILWLTGEQYDREVILAEHAAHMPRDVMWHADPSGAREIAELQAAGFKVRRADNEIRPGIAAVHARLQSGRLKVLEGACPNLLMEASLYRWNTELGSARSEAPVPEDNHALDALRYLISRLDARTMARIRRGPPPDETPTDNEAPPAAAPTPRKEQKWLRYDNEELWTPLQ
jgi:hypothetical protein